MSDDDDENSAEAVVQRYMERVSLHITVPLVCYLVHSTQLNKQMGYQEIKEFASLLRQYREENMHVTEFCTKLQELYGEDRKFLLPGKRKSCCLIEVLAQKINKSTLLGCTDTVSTHMVWLPNFILCCFIA